MKNILILFTVLCLAGTGCSNKNESSNNNLIPRTTVTLTKASCGYIPSEITFTATTAYLNKSVVSAPVSGFITESFVEPGKKINTGELVYKIISKEQHAINDDTAGITIPIRVPNYGIVTEVLQQAGGYVTEGTLLCTVAETKSLVFIVSVPFEYKKYVHTNGQCKLELPDGRLLTATIQSSLANMDIASQTEQIIVNAESPSLPEGMRIKAIFTTNSSVENNDIMLPADAVQSNETLTENWIMKLSSDSIAVKVPVEIVRRSSTSVEIRPGAISLQDNIILTGAYGLEDGAKVTVNKQ